MLGQFAQVRALMKRVWPWARVDPGRPVFILAVRDEGGLRRLLPEFWEKKGAFHPAGVFVRAPDRHWVALRMDVARDRAEDETWDNPYHVVFHEYVHLVLDLNFVGLPGWLNEGLAEYWGSTIISGSRIYQGRYIGYHIRTLRNSTLLPIERVAVGGGRGVLRRQPRHPALRAVLGARALPRARRGPAEGADQPVRRPAALGPSGRGRTPGGLRRRRGARPRARRLRAPLRVPLDPHGGRPRRGDRPCLLAAGARGRGARAAGGLPRRDRASGRRRRRAPPRR